MQSQLRVYSLACGEIRPKKSGIQYWIPLDYTIRIILYNYSAVLASSVGAVSATTSSVLVSVAFTSLTLGAAAFGATSMSSNTIPDSSLKGLGILCLWFKRFKLAVLTFALLLF